MKYFEVEECKLAGNIETHYVYSDGTYSSEAKQTIENAEALLWYRVTEYEEDGHILNVIDYNIYGADYESALEKIKEDHQPDEWQNHNW